MPLKEMTFSAHTFSNQTIRLDNIHYENCIFESCELVYGGYGFYSMDNCQINQCRISMDGSAKNTLTFLSFLHNVEPSLADDFIESIKANRLGESR
jgi:hypothetical protein